MNDQKKNTFDAVKMMRDIRDKVSSETMNMDFEELNKYITLRLEKSEFVKDKSKENKKDKL